MDTVMVYQKCLSPDQKDVSFFKQLISVGLLCLFFRLLITQGMKAERKCSHVTHRELTGK